MNEGFLQDLAVVMLVAGVVTIVFHRLRQPVVLGYILAGVVVGPYTPGIPLTVADKHTVEIMSELGVILLMFSLGLHFSLRKLAQVGATAFIAATLEIVLMVGVGYGIGTAFGWNRMDSLFLGAILSISSTTIIMKALAELGLTRQPSAQLIFGVLIVEDILAIAMIALLSGIARTGTLAVGEVAITLGRLSIFLVSVLVAGLLLVPALLRYVNRFKSPEMLLIASLGLCFGVSLLALKLGYSVALGAFLIGAIVAEAREHGRIEELIGPVRDMFSAIFFVAIGMLIDPTMLLTYTMPIAVISAAVVVGKVLACSLGTFLAGHDARTSMRVGMGLAQIGEFSFIIASLGLSLGVTSSFLYPIAVAVSAITTLLTPYLIRSSDVAVNGAARIVPRGLRENMRLYSQWVSRLSADSRGQSQQIRRLLRKWTLQILLNLALMTGLFVAAAATARWLSRQLISPPPWLTRINLLAWLAAMVLSLPLLIVNLRKLRAIALVVAERSAPGKEEQKEVLRTIIGSAIRLVFGVLMGLYVLVLSWALVPSLPVLVAMSLLVIGLAAMGWRRFERVYSAAQISLYNTLTQEPEPPREAPPPLPGVLRDAKLETIEIKPGSTSVGKLIRELQLRSSTGASAVGIERDGANIINPGPDEELVAGDRVLLLGQLEQLEAARKLLTGA
jgi:CPA2 family monovalent cation:H+ antiporter-2